MTDPAKGLAYDNLELIRSFVGSAPEKGFILVHVAMVIVALMTRRQTLVDL